MTGHTHRPGRPWTQASPPMDSTAPRVCGVYRVFKERCTWANIDIFQASTSESFRTKQQRSLRAKQTQSQTKKNRMNQLSFHVTLIAKNGELKKDTQNAIEVQNPMEKLNKNSLQRASTAVRAPIYRCTLWGWGWWSLIRPNTAVFSGKRLDIAGKRTISALVLQTQMQLHSNQKYLPKVIIFSLWKVSEPISGLFILLFVRQKCTLLLSSSSCKPVACERWKLAAESEGKRGR